jgi:hypothetical protein
LFALGEDELLDFEYLMVVKGTRRLKIPSVSSSFMWSGQDVASLAGQGSIYILAKSELLDQETDEIDESYMQVECLYLTSSPTFGRYTGCLKKGYSNIAILYDE